MSDEVSDPLSFHNKDVEIVKRETIFRGFFQMEKVQLRYRLFGGGWSQLHTRELFVRNPAVAAIMYDPSGDLIGLVEQFRIGACGADHSPWLFEIVAGVEEPGEKSIEVITRELREEANVSPERLIPICDYFSSPGGSTESVMLFCALCDLSEVNGIHGLSEENENVRVWVQPAEEILSDLYSGRYNNAATLICLQWLKMNRTELVRKGSNDTP